MDIFWDLKESYLKSWFTDIDTVENFMKARKLLVWVCLEGLPLVAWTESVLCDIRSRWGELIRLDPDTANKKRFDVARLLIGVKCLSAIPPFFSIVLNGNTFILKVSTTSFEDERCWIDNGELNGSMGCAPASFSGGSPRTCMEKGDIADPKRVIIDDELLRSQKKVLVSGGDSPRADLADTLRNAHEIESPKQLSEPNKRSLGHDATRWPSKKMGPSSEIAKEAVGWAEGCDANLVDVHVKATSVSNDSSAHSVSIEPVFNSTGLFHIKPKSVTHWKRNNIRAFETNFSKVLTKGSTCSPKIKISSFCSNKKDGFVGSKGVQGSGFERWSPIFSKNSDNGRCYSTLGGTVLD
ncbi:hypothetical protein V6N13_037533 [Hibiscus sabdariffa]